MYMGSRHVINSTWKRWFVNRHPNIILTFKRNGWPGKTAYKYLLQGLKNGKSLLIFPEGDSFPSEGHVMPFSNGVAHFALKTGVPVVPVGLCGTTELYYKKHLIMQLGAPIYVSLVQRRSMNQVAEIRERVRKDILSLIHGYRYPDITYKPMHWLTYLL